MRTKEEIEKYLAECRKENDANENLDSGRDSGEYHCDNCNSLIEKMNKTWLDKEIEFNDFIWKEGLDMCGKCINKELFKDFEEGGKEFENMKKLIIEKFPTKNNALKIFNQSRRQ